MFQLLVNLFNQKNRELGLSCLNRLDQFFSCHLAFEKNGERQVIDGFKTHICSEQKKIITSLPVCFSSSAVDTKKRFCSNFVSLSLSFLLSLSLSFSLSLYLSPSLSQLLSLFFSLTLLISLPFSHLSSLLVVLIHFYILNIVKLSLLLSLDKTRLDKILFVVSFF